MSNLLYSTDYGKYYLGKCEQTIQKLNLKGKVQLILTSPPFPLNNKKQYGNLIAYLIKQMLTIRPSLLAQTLFVKDGPLAFFGQTANLHKPMRQLMIYLNEHHAIYLVGLEKSGSFVEHAVQASKRMLPKQMLLLGNSYIYKYIIPGNGKDNEPYASSSYYGHKVIFKSEHNNVYVATIPNTQAKVEPQIDDYININEILYNITDLKCDLYYNSLIPVVLANKLVSLADHPSSDLLKSFAQEKIKK